MIVVLLSLEIKLYRRVQTAITCVKTLLKPSVKIAFISYTLAKHVEKGNLTLN